MNVWLTLHVLGAIVLVGNIITAAFWKVRADRSAEPAVMYHAAKNVMAADFVFTLPGIVLIVISGTAMAAQGGYSLAGLNWLTLSLALFALTGIVWLLILLPLQRRMISLSLEGMKSGIVPPGYRRASLYWAIFGTAATLLPVAILYLMVSKGF